MNKFGIQPYAPRVFVGEIVQLDKEPAPSTYKDIANANDHLHKVLNALLKERSGQSLTDHERELITNHAAMKRWQLNHATREGSEAAAVGSADLSVKER